jgi:tRNA (guanine-N7-)-methyltransferase
MSGAPAFIPSFGRRKGHKLRPSRSNLMETLLPTLLIPLPEGQIEPSTLFGAKTGALWFEIGFGGGEHLTQQAEQNRDTSFIGCEPYINGVAKLLASIGQHTLTNIRLYDGDARLLLEKLPDSSIDRLFILFPDPWPKVRHHKRRIISAASLSLFHRKLKTGGLLRIATDHVEYGTWMLEHLLAFGQFAWAATSCNDWQTPQADWVKTRYQGKAEAEGRRPLFLDFIK